MTVKRVLVIAATTVATATAGSTVLAGSVAEGAPLHSHAAPQTTLHLPTTVKVVARNTGSFFTHHKEIINNSLRYRGGSPAGTGVYTCVQRGATLDCDTAWALPDGIFITHELIDLQGGSLSGRIIDGTGRYKDATGTIKGTGRSDGSALVTFDYSTG